MTMYAGETSPLTPQPLSPLHAWRGDRGEVLHIGERCLLLSDNHLLTLSHRQLREALRPHQQIARHPPDPPHAIDLVVILPIALPMSRIVTVVLAKHWLLLAAVDWALQARLAAAATRAATFTHGSNRIRHRLQCGGGIEVRFGERLQPQIRAPSVLQFEERLAGDPLQRIVDRHICRISRPPAGASRCPLRRSAS